MNEFYSMLMQFTQGSECARKHLRKNYSEELIDRALHEKYIEESRKNDIGEPIYIITTLGKEKRDN